MRFKIFITFALIFTYLEVSKCYDLSVGSLSKNKLHTNKTVLLPAIAGVVRSEIVDVRPQTPIKAIKAIDLNKSSARPNITLGGLGYNFVSIKLKSDRGKSLKYRVEVYV